MLKICKSSIIYQPFELLKSQVDCDFFCHNEYAARIWCAPMWCLGTSNLLWQYYKLDIIMACFSHIFAMVCVWASSRVNAYLWFVICTCKRVVPVILHSKELNSVSNPQELHLDDKEFLFLMDFLPLLVIVIWVLASVSGHNMNGVSPRNDKIPW